MKNVALVLGGLCAAIAAFMVVQSKQRRPVPELARELEAVWKSHNTVA